MIVFGAIARVRRYDETPSARARLTELRRRPRALDANVDDFSDRQSPRSRVEDED
jgi:hypothetical protein